MESLLGTIGTLGALFMLLAYFLLVIDQLKGTDTPHIALNMAGALCIAAGMRLGQEIPWLIILTGWVFISIYGLYKHHVALSDTAVD